MQQGIGKMNNALAMLQNGNVAVQSGVVGVQNEDARVQRAVARAGKMWFFSVFGQKLIAEMGIWHLMISQGCGEMRTLELNMRQKSRRIEKCLL